LGPGPGVLLADGSRVRQNPTPFTSLLLLIFFFLNGYRFEVFGIEDLAAIEAFNVFHSVAPGNDLGTGVLTSGLHKARLRIYSNEADALVKGLPVIFF
jgi:hypothetical protein